MAPVQNAQAEAAKEASTKTLRQLGGKAFEEAYGKSLDCFLLSFWDVGSEPKTILPLSDQSQAEHMPNQARSLSIEEKKRRNIELAAERQRSAERRTANNIAEASENNQLAQHQRAVNKQLMELKQKVAREAKAERAQKVKDQETNAKEKRMKRAQKVEDQEANAERKIIERALRGPGAENGGRGTKTHSSTSDTVGSDANAVENDSPLATAAYNGHREIGSLMLDNGADINAPGRSFSCAALQEAVHGGHESILKLLLETREVNADSKDEDGRTSLSWDATGEHEVVEQLLGEELYNELEDGGIRIVEASWKLEGPWVRRTLWRAVEASWGLNSTLSQKLTCNKWTTFQEKFMESWPEHLARHSYDAFWMENEPVFHAYDYGANIEIEVSEGLQSLGQETRLRPREESDEKADADSGHHEKSAPEGDESQPRFYELDHISSIAYALAVDLNCFDADDPEQESAGIATAALTLAGQGICAPHPPRGGAEAAGSSPGVAVPDDLADGDTAPRSAERTTGGDGHLGLSQIS
ncbi:hypothetical protein V496_02149 [Pseudogymnoascus sp. VKM F-4515 (FW-2607)]|nr:hypothetical protein V496_02149 [Pseudogymnoascus sp. VKM F-4515 (FW-2607)]